MKIRRYLAIGVALMLIVSLTACRGGGSSSKPASDAGIAAISNDAWMYNADDDVFYQLGIPYCGDPADESYEKMAIFVPGAYFDATENEDGTYTCEIAEGWQGGYTASTAPIVIPVNTPGYSAQEALTEYTSVSDYTYAGFVYVHAGCRGRDAGAPAGVTDLKAAIRYLRYNAAQGESFPGNVDKIFTFGMSGGGAQSAIVGASGDSELYTPYLEAIGAVMDKSDAVCGSMCWCPITGLDVADASYEWMMGSTRSGLSDEEQKISDKLAAAFGDYINNAGIKDENGRVLTLIEDPAGVYQSGTYYEYMKAEIEDSLNHFLEDTEFPYEASSASQGGGMMGGGQGHGDGQKPDPADGEKPDGAANDMANAEQNDNIKRNKTSSGLDLSGSYETAQDYINALNANKKWVTYDEETNTVKITSIADFVSQFKTASKGLGAFDQLDAGQGENVLFGYGDGSGAHFDETLANILNEAGSSYTVEYDTDLDKEDSLGNKVQTRVNMYTPLYYLLQSQQGYKTSVPASFWRIRSGINQGDTSLSTEMDLALALQNDPDVKSVDFETVWGQGHTMAERTGDSTTNFITWINECLQDEE